MTTPSGEGGTSVGPFDLERHQRFLVFLLLLGIVLLWVPPLPSSLWLDETFTSWAIKDGLWTSLDRAHRIAHFGLYFAIVWLATLIGGMREWVLRLPSLAGALLASWALIHLGEELADRETGLLAAVIFATLATVSFAAADARPYALGLMSVVGAMYFEARWLATGRRAHAVAFALLASATLHFQKLFVGVFLVFALYAWKRRAEVRRLPRDSMILAGAVVLVCVLPLVADTMTLVSQSASLSWSSPPSLSTLALMSLPPVLVMGLLGGLFLASRLVDDMRTNWRGTESGFTGFFVVWILAPPLFLMVVSLFSQASVFNSRYALAAVPGIALLAARIVRAIEPARARRIIVQAVVFLSVAAQFAVRHLDEDWRGGVAAARKESRFILARIGTIEANTPGWLSDPEMRSYLLAPLTAYGVDEHDAAPLPWRIDRPDQEAYVEQLVSDLVARESGFVLVSRAFGDLGATSAWLRGRLAPMGFCSRSLGNFGELEVVLFTKERDDCLHRP